MHQEHPGATHADDLIATEWMTVARLAGRLDLRVGHLRSLVARREIPHCKIGRLVRFHWPTVERWLLGDAGSAIASMPASVRP